MEGRYAIFTEKWIVSYAQIRSVETTDRWLKARIQLIPTSGLYGKNEIGIGCVYEYLTFGRDIWADYGYCRWAVFFAPTVIDEVLRIAASFPKGWECHPSDPDFDARFAALRKPLSEYQLRVAPSPDYVYLKRWGVIKE